MLAPEEVERLGWGTSAQASRAEWEMLQAVLRSVRGALSRGTVATAAQLQAALYSECREIARRRAGDLTRAAEAEAVAAMTAALDADIARAGIGAADALRAAVWAAEDRARTMARVGAASWARHAPLDMAQDAQAAYLGAVTRHATLVAAGAETEDQAVARAFVEASDRGVRAVEYGSGHRSSPDVAARAAIRTIVTQAGNAQTLDVCRAAGIRLIEVSSHSGARPSHQQWQGRVYADPGPWEAPDGETYEDFGEGTGYYGGGRFGALGDRLCGVNCRHSFAPYVAGTPRTFSHDPDAERGWDADEVYEDTQRQRALERRVRKAKDRADALAGLGTDEGAARAAEARAQARAAQAELRRLVASKDWLQRDYRLERSREQMAALAARS